MCYTNKGLTEADKAERLRHASYFCETELMPMCLLTSMTAGVLGVAMLIRHCNVVAWLLLGICLGTAIVGLFMAAVFIYKWGTIK